MEVSELNRARVKLRWQRVHSAEEKFISENTEVNKHLKARIHGYLCGDGSVSWRKERFNNKLHAEIRFYPDHKSLVDSFNEAFHEKYGRKMKVKKLRNHFKLSITSMTIAKDLLKDSSFTGMKWSIPNWIKENDLCAKEWLRAFFDCEAYVGRKRICVQCVNKDGLNQIKEMLKQFDIHCNEYEYKRKNPNWNTNYHLVINKINDRTAFLKRLGFNHKDKMNKLIADVA